MLLSKFGTAQQSKKKFKISDSGQTIAEVIEQEADLDPARVRAEWSGFKFFMFRFVVIQLKKVF